MPIDPIILQRRLYEIGRLRLGEQVEGTRADGSTYTRPKKLGTFRFTSRDAAVIERAAEKYGGEARPWTDDGRDEWEVLTPARFLEVVVPPPPIALSQWLELWSGGGCERRCDGRREVIGDRACVCDPDARECEPSTRLSVMIPDLEGVGLWRMDTHSWNAAAELQGAVDLAGTLAATGTYLPARLRIDIRTEKKPGEPVKKFAVPVLDLDVSMSALAAANAAAITGGTPIPVTAGVDPDASAAHFGTVPPRDELPAPSVLDAVTGVGHGEPTAPRANAQEAIPATGLAVRDATVAPLDPSVGVPSPPDDDEAPPAPAAGGDGTTATGSASPTPDAEPPAAPPAPDPDQAARTRQVAIWCGQAGLNDDGRHQFLEAFSGGRYASAKVIPADDVPAIRAALVRLSRGDLVLEEREGRWRLTEAQFGWESTDPGAVHRPTGTAGAAVTPPGADVEHPPGPVAAPTGAGPGVDPTDGSPGTPPDRNGAHWRARVTATKGLGETRLLNQARKLAHAGGHPQPEALDDIPAGIAADLDAWVDVFGTGGS